MKMRNARFLAGMMTIVVPCIFTSVSSGATIAAWNYGGTAEVDDNLELVDWQEDQVLHVTNGVTVTDWNRVGGSSQNEGAYFWNGSYFLGKGMRNVNAAFDPSSKYLSLTVTALDGYSMTLSSFDYNTIWCIDGVSTGPATYRLGYSLDSGVTWTYSDEREVLWQDNIPRDDGDNYLYSYIGANTMDTWDFPDVVLSSGQTIEFRLWAYGPATVSGATLNSAGGFMYVSEQAGEETAEFVLHGTLDGGAVPEPSTIATGILGFGILAGWSLRRRRLKHSIPSKSTPSRD